MTRAFDVHVWVDETRPRNQGSALTAFELGAHGVPHTIVADNAGGHLMQHGKVDLAIVGTDRTTRTGDVANKIGTYLKALAAKDNRVPFYVALPHSTIDWRVRDGLAEIPIEQRCAAGADPCHRPQRRRRPGDGAAVGAGQPGGQSGIRCHAGTAGDRAHHRARHLPGQRGRPASALSGAAEEMTVRQLAALITRARICDISPS